MAAPVISISSDVSVESVGSSFLRVILIGSISVEVPVTPKVGAAAVSSPAGVLELDYSFIVRESDTEMPERHVSLTTSTLYLQHHPIYPHPLHVVARCYALAMVEKRQPMRDRCSDGDYDIVE
ncbi:hypothetical protein Tco_0630286 [Tanacetum coccineum]